MNISTTKGILKRIHMQVYKLYVFSTSIWYKYVNTWYYGLKYYKHTHTLFMFFSFSFFGFSLFCAWERWREREREREREFTFLNTLQDDHYESYNTWGINVHFLIITRSTQNQKNTKFLFPFFISPYSTCNNYLIYFGLVILIVFFYIEILMAIAA